MSAFTFAFYMLLTRAIAAHLHPVTQQLHTSLAGSLICLPLLWLADGTGMADAGPGDAAGLGVALAVRRGLLGRRHRICA